MRIMKRDNSSAHIKQEELDFIRELFPHVAREIDDLEKVVTVSLPEGATDLLYILGHSTNLRLQANVGKYTLVFEPRIDANDNHSVNNFYLDYPSIIETNGHTRNHRVGDNTGDIHIQENGKTLPQTKIENISETGINLVSESPIPDLVPGKTLLSLKLQFPHEHWVTCKARVVRATRRGRHPKFALHFIRTPERAHQLLREYVYHHTPDVIGMDIK